VRGGGGAHPNEAIAGEGALWGDAVEDDSGGDHDVHHLRDLVWLTHVPEDHSAADIGEVTDRRTSGLPSVDRGGHGEVLSQPHGDDIGEVRGDGWRGHSAARQSFRAERSSIERKIVLNFWLQHLLVWEGGGQGEGSGRGGETDLHLIEFEAEQD
jgi:hypothetical protein